MVAVKEFSWEDISAPDFGTTRQAFRQAVADVAASAKAKLPESNGRVEKAVALVLAGDVVLGEQHTALVYSQTDADTSYAVRPGFCSCKDFDQAPQGLCKHRLAAAMLRRALDAAPPQPPARPPLPEAPASVNCHVTIGGRQVQLTLRDTDETRLLERLSAVLELYPQTTCTGTSHPAQTSPQSETPVCQYHGAMKESTKAPGTSFCPSRMGDGSYCKERFPAKGK